MKHRIFTQLLFLIFAITLQAQNTMSDINRIKRDKNYLYGEATLNTKEGAIKLAYELLELEIKNWATQKSTDISSVLASRINDYADTIILPRGNMIRAFAYVKTSNLKALKGKSMAVKVGKEEVTPVVEEKTPVVEAPVPVVEAPVPVVEAPAPVVETPAPVVEEPAPVPEVVVKTNEEEVLEHLLPLTTFYDLEKTIKPLKEEGKITDYGKYTTMSDPANSYLIIYDQQASIKAILGKGTSSRKNLKTGLDDSEKNYRGCGAIWFKVK